MCLSTDSRKTDDNLEIHTLKKAIDYAKNCLKETDKIKCKYAIEDGAHYAVIKSEDDKILHAIIKLS